MPNKYETGLRPVKVCASGIFVYYMFIGWLGVSNMAIPKRGRFMLRFNDRCSSMLKCMSSMKTYV